VRWLLRATRHAAQCGKNAHQKRASSIDSVCRNP
jgi:hypothetical protein